MQDRGVPRRYICGGRPPARWPHCHKNSATPLTTSTAVQGHTRLSQAGYLGVPVAVAGPGPSYCLDIWPELARTCGRGSGLFDQDSAGVEQIEALALHVLLRLGPRLRGDNRDVAAGGRGVGEPG